MRVKPRHFSEELSIRVEIAIYSEPFVLLWLWCNGSEVAVIIFSGHHIWIFGRWRRSRLSARLSPRSLPPRASCESRRIVVGISFAWSTRVSVVLFSCPEFPERLRRDSKKRSLLFDPSYEEGTHASRIVSFDGALVFAICYIASRIDCFDGALRFNLKGIVGSCKSTVVQALQ